MPAEIIFLSSLAPTTSTKSKEIVKSEVRSHAARISRQKAGRSSYTPDAKPKTTNPSTRATIKVKRWYPTLLQKSELEARPSLSKGVERPDCVSLSSCPNSDLNGKNGLPCSVERKESSMDARHATASKNLHTRVDRHLVGDVEKLSAIYWNITAVCSAKFCSMMNTKNVLDSEWLQHMNDEAFFHVGAALVKSEHKELQCLGSCMDQEVYCHKVKALKIIHTRLTQSNGQLDNVTLLAILFLPFTDDLIADKNACLIHWGAAAKILATPGRLRAIKSSQHGAYTLDVINQVRGFCLMHTGFDLLSEIPKTVVSSNLPSTSICSASSDAYSPVEFLPDGIRTLSQCGLVGGHTFSLAPNIIYALQSGKRPALHNPTFDRRLNIQASTSNFQEAWDFFNLMPSSVIGEPSIEEVVDVAMIVYSTRTIGPIRMASFVSRSARAHLSIVVQECICQRSQEEEDALFWAFTVAVESWKTKFGEVVGDGIAIRKLQMSRFPEYLFSDTARLTLEKFFCDADLLRFQERYTKDFWS